VAADHRERPGQVAGDDVFVGVAQSAAAEFDENLTRLRRIEVDLLDTPFGAAFPENRRLCFHSNSSRVC
jgi:hypothetical protein